MSETEERKIDSFRKQIEEDIKLIQDDFSERIRYDNDNYVFNHWILDKIYGLDGEILKDNIIDQAGDKQIDCFVDFPDTKKLYIIQNKYYSNSKINESTVLTFLSQPIRYLEQKTYPNKKLQEIFTTASDDSDYEIEFDLYSCEDKFSPNLLKVIQEFNNKYLPKYKANIFSINDLYQLYYGENPFANKSVFQYDLLYDSNKSLEIGEGNNLLNDKFLKAQYIAISVGEIYEMYKEAKKQNYNIFDDNIREYLGSSKINNQIISTLKNKEDRKCFFYYNNGITLTCRQQKKKIDTDKKNIREASGLQRKITLEQPQIINGCQTVNAIYDVLDNDIDTNVEEEYKDAYVLVKILDFKKGNKQEDKLLYNKIVKCTNSQNAIKLSDFAANNSYFERIQKECEKRGFLLEVKRSDKNKFKHKSKDDINELYSKACKAYPGFVNSKKDIEFSLEKMILVYIALFKNGYYAYTKKSVILKPSSDSNSNSNSKKDYYENYSKKLDILSFDSLVRMYLLFLKIEADKKHSDDKRTPIPYYVFSLVGYLLHREKEGFENRANKFFEEIFSISDDEFKKIYNYLCAITKGYTKGCEKNHLDYNKMIKTEIDTDMLDDSIKQAEVYGNQEDIKVPKEFFKSLNFELE